ncbi:hypothetical protein BUZ62_02770 [Staphylococcus pasteuri]|uniref:hypothetical protein n=1 Tax=Staphylococcus pasteuri TaxID=45972 RepID=UPI000D34570C|nr:hypothetical protein [Staphylococcus pasteuri]PTU87782.1 hypothetical protein BUZ62_02770 [Staphylococcus pasteuri]
MKRRVIFVIIAILSTVATIIMCAKYPTGPHTISLDKPAELWTAIGTIVAFALPALILSIFNHLTTRIISSVLQIIAIVPWSGLAVVAFILEDYSVGITAAISVILIIISTFVTLIVGSPKQKKQNS